MKVEIEKNNKTDEVIRIEIMVGSKKYTIISSKEFGAGIQINKECELNNNLLFFYGKKNSTQYKPSNQVKIH